MADDLLVHVIDDDEAMRNSLSFLLKAANIDVRVYNSATAFIANFKAQGSECIVTDVRMPEMDGLELLHQLKAKEANLPVILITGHGDVSLAVEAMKAGAVDFLEKPFKESQVLAAIELALQKNQDATGAAAELTRIRKSMDNLSSRERQVLDRIAAGLANKTIAFELGISPRTVEVYRSNVMHKMGASSLADLVRMTLRASPNL